MDLHDFPTPLPVNGFGHRDVQRACVHGTVARRKVRMPDNAHRKAELFQRFVLLRDGHDCPTFPLLSKLTASFPRSRI